MLVDLAGVKTFLWIEDTESDAQLTQLIPQAEAFFYSLVWVDTFERTTKDEIARIKDCEINFNNYPIVSINQIDGEVYSGVSWEDYIVNAQNVSFISPDFLGKVKLNKIKVNYTFGYLPEEVPEDIKLAIYIMVSWLYNIKENYGTVSCKIGQESLSFRDVSESEDFKRIVKKYKKKFIYVI